MKKSSIIALVLVAVAIGIVLSTFEGASSYVTFEEARAMHEDGSEQDVHVVGTLKKDSEGNIIGMSTDPRFNANSFKFTMVDTMRNEQVVLFNDAKPADIEQSEKIVVTGKYDGKVFVAKDILKKCPSKYTEEEFKTVQN